MRLKLIFQAFLALIILAIIILFYYSFIFEKNLDEISSEENLKKKEIVINKEIAEELVNIEFNSYDEEGNSYYINAEKAVIELDDKKKNLVKLYGVVSIINIKTRGIINIYSENAVYNKINHDTSFYNNVRAEYLDSWMISQNLDVNFTEKKTIIYNNVIYKNDQISLNTDKIFFNMSTGDIKLEMLDKTKKVKLETKYESFN